LAAPVQWGGQGLPHALNAACIEMWNSAAMAFGLGPFLTMAGVDALAQYGSDALKRAYLPKLVSGEWTGSMQLTEPHAGTDVGALRTRAERAADGSYRITGQKIFITYGEHDLTDNIIHFLLARLPDAPPGTRGVSLFLVPKFLLNADGSLGARNDVRAHSIEHKLGIHASPTCTMVYGDNGGAIGFLIGEENRGMACMFTMMNQARLCVGLQGVAIAERATQQALAYAQERRQGRATHEQGGMSPIIAHPDVKRMLLTMRALTRAARAICYATAVALDRAERSTDEAARKAAHERASLLTPIAKAFSSDIGIEVASLGIQAIDLVTRKLPLSGGGAVNSLIAELRHTVEAVNAASDPGLGWTGVRLEEALDCLERATRWLNGLKQNDPDTMLAGATPYLKLFAVAAGSAMLAEEALAAIKLAGADAAARVALARFFAENVAVTASALERIVFESADSVNNA